MNLNLKQLAATVLTTLLCTNAQAAFNCPNLSDVQNIGRLNVFMSPKKVVWYLPAAFRNELFCTDDPIAAEQMCILKVINALTEDEMMSLRQLEQKSGKIVRYFSDTDFTILKGVSESFSGPILQIPKAKFSKLQTLNLNARGPYANAFLAVPSAMAKQLTEAFNHDGVGTFTSEVSFKGEVVEDYVSITNFEAFRRGLEQWQGKTLSREERKTAVLATLKNAGLTSHNFTPAEELAIAASFVNRSYFIRESRGFKVNMDRIGQINETVTIVDESYGDITTHCTVRLELKKNASPTIECRENEA